MKKFWGKSAITKSNFKYLLPVALVLLHALVLNRMPVYLDDTGFLELFRSHNWDTGAIFRYNFDTYKFYRVLGFDLNYLYYRFFVHSVDVAILLNSVLYFMVVHGYLTTFQSAYLGDSGEGDSEYYLLFLVVLLSLPFSYYLIIFRYSFIGLASYLVNLMAIRCVYRAASGSFEARSIYFLALCYFVSLYIYEATLLLPAYYVSLAWTVADRRGCLPRGKAALALGLLAGCLLVYLFSQVYFIQHQPKLMKDVSATLPVAELLGVGEQLIKKLLSLLYFINWSWYYFRANLAGYGTLQLACIAFVPLLCGGLLWRVLSRLDRVATGWRAGNQLVDGVIIFAGTFGLWSYYWIFARTFTTPPLYALFLPTLGLGLLTLGMLTRLAPLLGGRLPLRVALFCLLLTLFTSNLVCFLSARMSIQKSLADAAAVAARVSGLVGEGQGNYSCVVLCGLADSERYAHYLSHFDAHLKFYLNTQLGKGAALPVVHRGVVIYPVGAGAADLSRPLYLGLDYDAKSKALLRLVSLPTGDAAVQTGNRTDPCRVALWHHELYFDSAADRMVFRKQS
jgi:hypothetical protein